jgi:TolC family type I secretion outer membrane protein
MQTFMRHLLLLVAVFVVYTAPLHAASLRQAVSLALENNPELQVAKEYLDSVKYDVDISRAAYLPSLEVSGSTRWNEFNTDNSEDENYNAHGYSADFKQKIVDVASYRRYQTSKKQLKQEYKKYHQIYNNTIRKTVEVYFQYLKKMTQIKTTRLELASTEQRIQHVKISAQHGNMAKSAIYEAQAKRDRVRSRLIFLKRDLGVSRERLFNLTQHNIEPTFNIESNFDIKPIDRDEEKQWSMAVIENNDAVQIAKDAIDISKKELQKRDADFVPVVDFSVSYNYESSQDQDLNADLLNGRSNDTTYSLNLTVPILSGGERYYSRKKSSQLLGHAYSQYDATVSSALLKLRELILNINYNAESVDAYKSAIQSNYSSYEVIQKGNEIGVRTLSDVLAAERLLYDSIREYHDVHYDYVLNRVQFLEVVGDLDEDKVITLSNTMKPFSATDPLVLPHFVKTKY